MIVEPASIFEQHRRLMFSIAYRMLRRRADAEDVLQETYLRWQRTGKDRIENPAAFLAQIVKRLCLNELGSTRTSKEHYVNDINLDESMVILETDFTENVSIDESISTATLLLLERLKPVERAVFVMRDVFNYEYREIAATLRQREDNCRQVLHRARKYLASPKHRFTPSNRDHALFLQRFIAATRAGEVDSLIELLAADVKR